MALDQLNFRDLGGLTAATGTLVPGRLFRSEGPANFTPPVQARLVSYGIGNIIDLRSAGERDAKPHLWHGADCHCHGLNVDADLRVFGNDGRVRLLQGPDPQIAIDTMTETYAEIPQALLPHWPKIGEILLEGKPAMINCTAGKDRTGVAVAVVLEMLGVPRISVMRDYLKSSVFGDNLKRSGSLEKGLTTSFGFLPSDGQVEALIGVRREYLEAAWDAIGQLSHDVPSYLADAGMSYKTQGEIRTLLVSD